jgi:hypothetical protein
LLEVYLFCGPCCGYGREIENELREKLPPMMPKCKFNYLPLVNSDYIHNLIHKFNHPDTLDTYNDLYNIVYNLALDVKAVQLQGNRYVRDFLTESQNCDFCAKLYYDRSIIEARLEKIGADLEAYRITREGDWIKTALSRDQQTANEYNITDAPTAILFSTTLFGSKGFILENCSVHSILNLFHSVKNIQKSNLDRSLVHETPYTKYNNPHSFKQNRRMRIISVDFNE